MREVLKEKLKVLFRIVQGTPRRPLSGGYESQNQKTDKAIENKHVFMESRCRWDAVRVNTNCQKGGQF